MKEKIQNKETWKKLKKQCQGEELILLAHPQSAWAHLCVLGHIPTGKKEQIRGGPALIRLPFFFSLHQSLTHAAINLGNVKDSSECRNGLVSPGNRVTEKKKANARTMTIVTFSREEPKIDQRWPKRCLEEFSELILVHVFRMISFSQNSFLKRYQVILSKIKTP